MMDEEGREQEEGVDLFLKSNKPSLKDGEQTYKTSLPSFINIGHKDAQLMRIFMRK